MSDHVINVDPLDPTSVSRAEREIKRLIKWYEKKVDEFLVELAEIGKRAAQGAYGSAITVTVEAIANGVCIRANGDAVVFLEFGAGSQVNEGNMFANVMPFDVRRGSFSDSKVPPGEYARNNYEYWTFGGQRLEYVTPVNGMQKAYEAMQQDVKTLARKVFG